MRIVVTLIMLLTLAHVQAQAPDSLQVQVLTFDEYYRLVVTNHPIVRQARLLSDQAAQQVRLARGAFDPKLEGTYDFKEFKSTDYYNLLDVSLKVPVWFPVDPKVGVQRHLGEYVNPQNYISSDVDYRQVYAGISVPIGQGLFIDQRRATVRQAVLMEDMAEAEQVKQINKTLLYAAKDYWQWYFAYNNYVVMQQSIDIANDIFERTLSAYEFGEAAVVDTVQAKITLLNRITEMQQANIEQIKAGLSMANNLWSEQGEPLVLADNVVPEDPTERILALTTLEELTDAARENHPEIVKLQLKGEVLEIDRRLARENLKPRLDLNYYLLDQPVNGRGDETAWLFDENYKFGVDFAFPIFLRKERAKLAQTNLKLDQNQYQQLFTAREIINGVNGQYSAVVITRDLLIQQRLMVSAYQRLLEAERLNLANGESDLFKLNIQIDKLLEAQTKYLKLQAQYQKDVAELYWTAGIANLGLN